MKKIFNIILLATVVCLTSCDLDKESSNSIPFGKGFTDMGTIEALERGAYSRLRTSYSLTNMVVPDLQADYMHAVEGFSNTYGSVYQWTFSQNDQDIAEVWNNLYGGISQFNFILDGIDNKLGFEPSSAEQASLDQIKGRMYFMRALSYALLAERFCADYDSSTARNAHTGVPIVTKYDTGYKPARATLYDVYEQILDDIKQARTLLRGLPGSPNSTTINADCVTALEARVLLQMDDWANALKKANEVIGKSAYSLVDSEEELREMWTYDRSPETIFQFYASKTEVAYQWAIYFYSEYNNGTDPRQYTMNPDYIPTQDCVEKYDAADWRRNVYFLHCSAIEPVDGRFIVGLIKGTSMVARKMTILSKYPGNPDLRTSSVWNYYNTFKVFRLAEMYLIAAEAAARSNGDAATPLNELRSHRGLPALTQVTLAEVQEERYREMIMEGTRLTDLKRWGLGMTRGKAQEGQASQNGGVSWKNVNFVTKAGSDISKSADDYMFVWPIPQSDISSNEQLADQQNPGWER